GLPERRASGGRGPVRPGARRPRPRAAGFRPGEPGARDLLFDLRNSLGPLGQNSRAVDCLERARTQAADADDSARLARAEAYLALHYQMAGEPARALAAGERALALAARLCDPATAIVARQ